MDERSTLRCMSTLTTTQWHHFVSTSYPEPPTLTQVMWIELFEATTICRWTAYQCAQTLRLCLWWMMQEAVWDGCQPQPWLITSFWLHKWPRTPSDPSSVGIPIWDYCRSMPLTSISMCQNTLFMSVMDDGSTLRRMSTLTSTSYPAEPPNLTQVMWIELFENTTICRWTAYQCAQTLCLCLWWMMQEAVWDGCQPQPWLITSFWTLLTSDPEPQNLIQEVWVYLFKATTVCP
jgi:hypothetical protein